ncbi:hypothetical protein BN1013_00931 [Candidatus Rubidus massiliensis]|nr:hypothetical protein BN1013_00931 [Candidatus Rubidus massiliensis]
MFYLDYYWKNGRPIGYNKTQQSKVKKAFKIVSDPYFKRISIEKYENGIFLTTIYDSILLDFRKLKPEFQLAWKKTKKMEESTYIINTIQDLEDRTILLEKCLFKDNLCHKCSLYSCHDVLLSTHQLYYKHLGDPFNGIILYDTEGKIVMKKTYEICQETFEFSELIEENWVFEISNITL